MIDARCAGAAELHRLRRRIAILAGDGLHAEAFALSRVSRD